MWKNSVFFGKIKLENTIALSAQRFPDLSTEMNNLNGVAILAGFRWDSQERRCFRRFRF
jgi:hypothetical protein